MNIFEILKFSSTGIILEYITEFFISISLLFIDMIFIIGN